ncbi:MAG TPA: hypothetical protein VKY85_10680 [Candidatus Angelobacter sp.]|nr:hypothetical protein [Candidatus Angelobacter sp.]
MNEWEQNFQIVRRHPLFPFADYQNDDVQYMQAELYWTYLFKAVIGGNSDGVWRAWHAPDPERKGNPMFSAVNDHLRRGTRIIQHPDERKIKNQPGGLFSFQPFLSLTPCDPVTYDDPNGLVLELCFNCDISDESEARTRAFWQLFCIDHLDEVQIEAAIRTYESSVHT